MRTAHKFDMSDTLAVIPTYIRNERDYILTSNALKSLSETSDADIVVVDDGSPNRELVETLAEFARGISARVILKDRNEGFAKTVNYGLREAYESGKHGLLVNADIQCFNNNWLNIMKANRADVVGALLLYPNGLVQHAGIFFSVINRTFDHIHRMSSVKLDVVHKPRVCPVTGALQLIKHHVLRQVGFYDENFKLGWEDVDYCHMVFESGLKCALEPRAIAIHYESMFRGKTNEKIKKWQIESFEYLHKKHQGRSFAEYTPTLMWPDEI